MKIKRGDLVEVISGDDKGARGEVQRVIRGKRKLSRRLTKKLGRTTVYDPNLDRVVVAGVNFIKKHQRRTGNINTQVGIIEREAPIHVSSVMLVCPHCDQPTRVRIHVFEDGTRARECRKCGQLIDS
ncbi:MAG: 50S ribosomal protein L24 [Anaerolineae bacterium]|nr:50S ribosomal protein L24 [Anaerolineae bacterium]